MKMKKLKKKKNNNEMDVEMIITKEKKVKFLIFELWEKKTKELIAASFGYFVGSILHDYTFMTLKKDNRSVGSILTKTIADILSNCGYDIWYWGFKLDYMEEYEGKYGGKEIPRSEYWKVLKNSFKKYDTDGEIVNCKDQTVKDIQQFIKNGNAVIEPLPEWK